ncbi:MAG TPA: hypothetical protein H9987_10545 [Candidatus Luteococcus avicola]|nr:hypothetical protein [Candidatus Luteococcus avicola]
MVVSAERPLWVRSVPSAAPALLTALVLILTRLRDAPPAETVLQLLLCLVAGYAALSPRFSSVGSMVLLAGLLLIPGSDATYAALLCLFPLGCSIVLTGVSEGVVESFMFLGLVAAHSLTDQTPNVYREVFSWAGLLMTCWFVSILLRHQRRSNDLLEEHFRVAAESNNQQLAQRLHDTVAQSNARIVLAAENLKVQLDGRIVSESVSQVLDSIIVEALNNASDLRLLLGQLRANGASPPEVFNENTPGLKTVAEAHRELFARYGFTLQVTMDDALQEVPVAATHLVRTVVDEFSINILKHGRPGPCRLVLHTDPSAIGVLAVNTIGAGVHTSISHGHGLQVLGRAVERVGGELECVVSGTNWVARAYIPESGGKA